MIKISQQAYGLKKTEEDDDDLKNLYQIISQSSCLKSS